MLLVLRGEDAERFEAGAELLDVHESIVVLVQTLHQMDRVVLEVSEASAL